jgi:DNA-directed RNA polymerase subunit RPC12/RpoP
VKWIVEDGMAFPVCSRCGAYPLLKRGRDEYSNYLLQCGACGKTVVTKTNPTKLSKIAVKRYWGR